MISTAAGLGQALIEDGNLFSFLQQNRWNENQYIGLGQTTFFLKSVCFDIVNKSQILGRIRFILDLSRKIMLHVLMSISY